MRWGLAALVLVIAPVGASAQYNYGTGSNPNSHAVQGYTTNRGSYVAPHYQTNPDSSTHNNYGASGNVNPYNGRVGRGY